MSFVAKAFVWSVSFIAVYLGAIGLLTFVPAGDRPLVAYITKNNRTAGIEDFTFKKFQELKEVQEIDILFTGSSHALRGFDPRNFYPYRSFNLGTSGQTPFETYYLLKQYLPKLRPRLVIHETFFKTFTMDHFESVNDLITNTPHSWELFLMAFNTGKSRTFHAFVSEKFKRLKRPLSQVTQSDFQNGQYVQGGFVEDNKKYSGKSPPSEAPELQKFQFEYLEKMIHLSRAEGASLFMVQHPLPQRYIAKSAIYEEVQAKVKAITAKENIPYLDFQKSIREYSSGSFIDEEHLSTQGAKKFNLKLKKVLFERQLLPLGAQDPLT